jgi:soluble lytic murein transglycosylase
VRRGLLLLVLLAGLAVAALAVHRSMPTWYARLWYPLEYEQTIVDQSQRHGLDPALVASVIYRESRFTPDSRSSKGAVGLMQVLPDTARFIAAQANRPSPSPDRLEEPDVNIAYGTWYLRYLLDRHGSVASALAAYNAGEATLAAWESEASVAGRSFRVPDDVPYPETRGFVRGVLESQSIYRRVYGDRLTR